MNQNNDKKERMTITEVEGDTDLVKVINAYRLRKRQEACENANKLFGTNISVKFRIEDEEHDEKLTELFDKKTDEVEEVKEGGETNDKD